MSLDRARHLYDGWVGGCPGDGSGAWWSFDSMRRSGTSQIIATVM